MSIGCHYIFNATSVNMFKNKIDNYFKRSGYVYMWAASITGHSISQWLPCPVPSWVPNKIWTWGGNSVKFSYIQDMTGHRDVICLDAWSAVKCRYSAPSGDQHGTNTSDLLRWRETKRAHVDI